MDVVVDNTAVTAPHTVAQIQARPHASRPSARPLTGELVIADVQVHVPATYRAATPAGVLVMLHGAGGDAKHAFSLIDRDAAAANVVVVAPNSDDRTWDVIAGGFGRDVARIDRVLGAVFNDYAIDPARVAIGGFSDGASYALTLGLANGDLFRVILAFSPGFEIAPRRQGRPRIFISHGTDDPVLPISRASHRIVPALARASYDVEYLEFTGGHTVPRHALERGLHLLTAAATPRAGSAR